MDYFQETIATSLSFVCGFLKRRSRGPSLLNVQLVECSTIMLEKKDVTKLAQGVFEEIGPYASEHIYQNALVYELSIAQAATFIAKEVIVPILYKNYVVVSFGRADIVLYDENSLPTVIIELKAVAGKIRDEHMGQLALYLKHTNAKRGFVINFGKSLEVKEVNQHEQKKKDAL